jgi:ribosomal protein S18 acetylase RimI-like enzyme
MKISYRKAQPADVSECITLRGKTRQNAINATQLAALGVTHESWTRGIEQDELCGYVGRHGGVIVGYCFGETQVGEIQVLAVLPEYENIGMGKELLNRVVSELKSLGHPSLFLGCSRNPESRSYGFYRHLGWRATGKRDSHDDEILELLLPQE